MGTAHACSNLDGSASARARARNTPAVDDAMRDRQTSEAELRVCGITLSKEPHLTPCPRTPPSETQTPSSSGPAATSNHGRTHARAHGRPPATYLLYCTSLGGPPPPSAPRRASVCSKCVQQQGLALGHDASQHLRRSETTRPRWRSARCEWRCQGPVEFLDRQGRLLSRHPHVKSAFATHKKPHNTANTERELVPRCFAASDCPIGLAMCCQRGPSSLLSASAQVAARVESAAATGTPGLTKARKIENNDASCRCPPCTDV